MSHFPRLGHYDPRVHRDHHDRHDHGGTNAHLRGHDRLAQSWNLD
jgi:hypothetical protein